jgi:hypothetical protein
MEITQLVTGTIYVTDQQKSLDFYLERLGSDKRADKDRRPTGRWLEVAPHADTRARGTSRKVTDPDGRTILVKQPR